jgi:hypothetical protein
MVWIRMAVEWLLDVNLVQIHGVYATAHLDLISLVDLISQMDLIQKIPRGDLGFDQVDLERHLMTLDLGGLANLQMVENSMAWDLWVQKRMNARAWKLHFH